MPKRRLPAGRDLLAVSNLLLGRKRTEELFGRDFYYTIRSDELYSKKEGGKSRAVIFRGKPATRVFRNERRAAHAVLLLERGVLLLDLIAFARIPPADLISLIRSEYK